MAQDRLGVLLHSLQIECYSMSTPQRVKELPHSAVSATVHVAVHTHCIVCALLHSFRSLYIFSYSPQSVHAFTHTLEWVSVFTLSILSITVVTGCIRSGPITRVHTLPSSECVHSGILSISFIFTVRQTNISTPDFLRFQIPLWHVQYVQQTNLK